MKQGYNDRMDDSLGNRDGKKSSKEQNYKDRRDEAKAMNKAEGKRAYQSVESMDKNSFDKTWAKFKADTKKAFGGKYAEGGEIAKKIIGIAKTHSDSTETETSAYPINDDVPKRFLKDLGIGERKGRGQLLVAEIQFDTRKLLIQEYAVDDGTNDWEDGEIWSYDLDELPKDFQDWVIDNLISSIKAEKQGVSTYAEGGEIYVKAVQIGFDIALAKGVTAKQVEEFFKYRVAPFIDNEYRASTKGQQTMYVLNGVFSAEDMTSDYKAILEEQISDDETTFVKAIQIGLDIALTHDMTFEQVEQFAEHELASFINGYDDGEIYVLNGVFSAEDITSYYKDHFKEINSYAKGGGVGDYVAITLKPIKKTYKGGKGEAIKNMIAFHDEVAVGKERGDTKYPFIHFLSIQDSRKNDPSDMSELRIYMMGEKKGFDEAEKKGLYDLFLLEKSKEEIKDYAKGGSVKGEKAREFLSTQGFEFASVDDEGVIETANELGYKYDEKNKRWTFSDGTYAKGGGVDYVGIKERPTDSSWIKDRELRRRVDAIIRSLKTLNGGYGDGVTRRQMEFIVRALQNPKIQLRTKKQLETYAKGGAVESEELEILKKLLVEDIAYEKELLKELTRKGERDDAIQTRGMMGARKEVLDDIRNIEEGNYKKGGTYLADGGEIGKYRWYDIDYYDDDDMPSGQSLTFKNDEDANRHAENFMIRNDLRDFKVTRTDEIADEDYTNSYPIMSWEKMADGGRLAEKGDFYYLVTKKVLGVETTRALSKESVDKLIEGKRQSKNFKVRGSIDYGRMMIIEPKTKDEVLEEIKKSGRFKGKEKQLAAYKNAPLKSENITMIRKTKVMADGGKISSNYFSGMLSFLNY